MGRAVALTTFMIIASGSASAAPRGSPRALPPCQAPQLSLTLDDHQRGVDDQARNGIRLVLRNRSVTGCRIRGLPTVGFRDAGGHVLPIERQAPPGMHPGPVVLPAAVPAGGVVEASLEWTLDGVLTGGHCYSPATIEIAIGEQAITRPFHSRLCASPGLPAMFMQDWFRSNPIEEKIR